MGTHPIFESDFDCLTDRTKMGDEFSVRVNKGRDRGEKYSMMRFNVPIELAKWNQIDNFSVELRRDMSKQRIYDLKADELPQFGEGSEYKAREKEIARKMMLGHKIRKFDIDAQAWKMQVKQKDKEVKKYTGTKEGGIGDSSMYFVMRQSQGGAFQATAVEDWYNFKPDIKHRTLTHEEAEVEWERRETIRNKFSFMNSKRLDDQIEGMEDAIEGAGKGGRKKQNADLRIHGAEDDYVSSEDEFKRDRTKKARGKKNIGGKQGANDEALEDSDDGDEEGKEHEYMSDDSDDFDAVTQNAKNEEELAGVDQDIMSSSSEESDDADQDDETKEDEKEDEGDDNDDIDELAKNLVMFKNKPEKGGSRPGTPTEQSKRTPTPVGPLKRVRDEHNGSPGPSGKKSRDSPPAGSTPNSKGITQEQVRAALSIKPISTRELLKKFKPKKTGLSQEQIVTLVGSIMKQFESENIMTTKVVDGTKFFYIKER